MNNSSIKVHLSLQYSQNEGRGFGLDINTDIAGTGVTAIFGQSGSGKTTLLRCIAGLQRPDFGEIFVSDDCWQNKSSFLSPHKRPVGYVFQEASLLPHLTGAGNLNYALKRAPAPTPLEHYEDIVGLMGLEDILEQYPDSMSGGERQRVAIARALLVQPKLLLMDEPLASLDEARKREILPYLEKLKETIKVPILFVSHSIDEIARLADNLIVLKEGKITVEGELTSVLSRLDMPNLPGDEVGVVVEGDVAERSEKWGLIRVSVSSESLWIRDSQEAIGQKIRLRICARDVSLALERNERDSILNKLPVKVMEITMDQDPAMALIKLQMGETILVARLTKRSVASLNLDAGLNVWAQIKSVAVIY